MPGKISNHAGKDSFQGDLALRSFVAEAAAAETRIRSRDRIGLGLVTPFHVAC
jgi:hypothetical protein